MAQNRQAITVEACILAGGLSTRMGRDKSRLLLGQRTMPAHIRATARGLGLKVRVIRRDLVPRCGPLGGIFTALHTSRADAVLFLACDMPFVPASVLERLIQSLGQKRRAVFDQDEGRAGFPFVLHRESCLPLVARPSRKSERHGFLSGMAQGRKRVNA